MERLLTEAVADVLAVADREGPVSVTWIRERHPTLWLPVYEALRIEGIVAADADLLGRRIGPYRLVAELGRGGMGTVYLAREDEPSARASPRHVALKVVHPELVAPQSSLERVLQEAEIGRRVRHPNVVRVLAVGERDGSADWAPYLVMELVAGETLRSLLRRTGRVPEPLCRRIAAEVTNGLAAIHGMGIVHRDVKPDNVLITRGHRVKLMDLGVAYITDDRRFRDHSATFAGTLGYSAPEHVAGDAAELDGRADLYSLGVLLFELATGVHPDDAGGSRRALDRLSPFFAEVVTTLLAPQPADRFRSAQTLRRVLVRGEASAWWRRRRRLDGALPAALSTRLSASATRPLRGRESEFAQILAHLRSARRDRGAAVWIEGEAGIGKSRLVDAALLHRPAGARSQRILFGRYRAAGAEREVTGIAEAFRAVAGADRRQRSKRPALGRALSLLLRGQTLSTAQTELLTPESLGVAYSEMLDGLLRSQPVVLVLEDVHDAGDQEIPVLRHLCAISSRAPLVVLMTSRADGATRRRSAILPADVAHVLHVPELPETACDQLLDDEFAPHEPSPPLVRELFARAGGNPFRLLALVDALRDLDLLRKSAEGVCRLRTGTPIPVPMSVAENIGARVEHLTEEHRELLRLAACDSDRLDAHRLAIATGSEPLYVVRSLAELATDHGLLRADGDTFVFAHELVRESVRAELPEDERTRCHAVLAHAVQQSDSGADRESAAALCRHLVESGRVADAIPHLDEALALLERRRKFTQARELATSVLQTPDAGSTRQQVRLLLRRARYHAASGQAEQQARDLRVAVSRAQQSGDRASVAAALLALGEFALGCGDVQSAGEHLRDAEEVARAGGGETAAIGIHRALGRLAIERGHFSDARTQFERSLSLARARSDRRGESRALLGLGHVSFCETDFPRSRARFEESARICHELGDLAGEMEAMRRLGNLFLIMGRFADAETNCEQARRLAVSIGDRRGEARASGAKGVVVSQLGRIDAAARLFRTTLHLASQAGDRDAEARARTHVGAMLFRRGRLEAAEREILRGIEFYRESPSTLGGAAALFYLIQIRDAGGNHDGAQEALVELTEVTQRVGGPLDHAILLYWRAVLAGESDAKTARRRMFAALDALFEVEGAPLASDVLLRLADLELRSGQAAEATSQLDRAAEWIEATTAATPLVFLTIHRARLPGADPRAAVDTFERLRENVDYFDRIHAAYLLWELVEDLSLLHEAHRLLRRARRHAPAKHWPGLLREVRVHRAITAAWRHSRRAPTTPGAP